MSATLIASVTGGTCVTRNGNLVNNQTRSSAPAQQWILEPGPKAQSFAFRNVENNNYLHAQNGAASAAIGTGGKQFWTLEPGVAAGSCYLKCEDFPNAYMASKGANPASGNVVYVWPKQAVWTHALTWYLHDAKLEGFMPGGQGTTQSSAEQEAAVQAKEAEMKKREDLITARETALETNETAAAAKLVELQKKAADLEEKEKAIAVRESAPHETNGGTTDTTAKASELAVREAALKTKEEELSKQQTAIDTASAMTPAATMTNGTSSTSPSTSNTDLQAENARLKAELARLRDNHPFKLSPRTEKGTLRSGNTKWKNTFDPVLLRRFEEGRKLVNSNMVPLRRTETVTEGAKS